MISIATQMEAKLKHLEFIQSAVARMANNSFLLKGWTVTLVGGLLALTFKQIDRRYLVLSGAIALMFWSLDSYYLSQERKFIDLYNSARLLSENSTDFSMHTRRSPQNCRWIKCLFSQINLIFYGVLLAVQFVIVYFI